MILALVASACSRMDPLLKNSQGIRTVFATEEIPGQTDALTFSEIDWSWENKLTIQGFRIGYHAGFIGDMTAGNILPFYINESVLEGSIPLISKDGSYMAFQSGGTLYIVTMSKVASNNYSITPNSYVDVLEKQYRCNHAWSPDSRQLASVCLAPDGITISVYDLPRKSIQSFFEYFDKNIGEIEGASWSPDGTMLAFSLRYDYDDKPSQTDILSYSLEMGSLVRITNSPNISERDPDWYPRSRVLTFTATMEGDAESTDSSLMFSTTDGKCMKPLPNIKGLVYPSWSPDGSQLVYIDGWMEIKILDTSRFVPSDFLSSENLCVEQ
jgi:Tol biopolymer transport system component